MISENMKMMFEIGLVPLVVIDDAADAVPFGQALVDGGVPVAEVTFRTDACLDTIRAMRQHVPGLLVGAGTVHNVAQADAAVKAGAEFIVTPAFNPAVTQWCIDNHVDIVPGTVSPADVEAANGMGIEVCKFFPAAAYGGIKTLKALAGPFHDMKFLPTGGVNLDNMTEYLDLPNVAAVGGSFMTPSDMVRNKDWKGITATCRQAVHNLLGFEICHTGIHCKTQAEAEDVTDRLCALLDQEKITVPGAAYFVGTVVEVCYNTLPGEKGHIGIDTRDMDRAMAYYKRRGVEYADNGLFYDDQGRVRLAYFKELYNGFSVHLRRKPAVK